MQKPERKGGHNILRGLFRNWHACHVGRPLVRYHSLKHYCLGMLFGKHGEVRAWHTEELNKYLGTQGKVKNRSNILFFF